MNIRHLRIPSTNRLHRQLILQLTCARRWRVGARLHPLIGRVQGDFRIVCHADDLQPEGVLLVRVAAPDVELDVDVAGAFGVGRVWVRCGWLGSGVFFDAVARCAAGEFLAAGFGEGVGVVGAWDMLALRRTGWQR